MQTPPFLQVSGILYYAFDFFQDFIAIFRHENFKEFGIIYDIHNISSRITDQRLSGMTPGHKKTGSSAITFGYQKTGSPSQRREPVFSGETFHVHTSQGRGDCYCL